MMKVERFYWRPPAGGLFLHWSGAFRQVQQKTPDGHHVNFPGIYKYLFFSVPCNDNALRHFEFGHGFGKCGGFSSIWK